MRLLIIFLTFFFIPGFALQFEKCLNAEPDTFVAITNDCRSFIYCGDDEESSFQDFCPEDTYFNAEQGECQIDFDNICPANSLTSQEDNEVEDLDKSEETTTQLQQFTTEIITTTPAAITTISAVASTVFEHITEVPTRPQCSRYIDAYYPHFQRCEYYFKCIAGYLTILRCNFQHAWDYQRQMCVPFNMVKCYGKSRIMDKKSKKSKWNF